MDLPQPKKLQEALSGLVGQWLLKSLFPLVEVITSVPAT